MAKINKPLPPISAGATPQFFNAVNDNIIELDTKTDALETKASSISTNGQDADFKNLKKNGLDVLDSSFIQRQELLMRQQAASGNTTIASAQYENIRVPFAAGKIAQRFGSFGFSNGLFTANRSMKLFVSVVVSLYPSVGGAGLLVLKSRKNNVEYNRVFQQVPIGGGGFYTIPLTFVMEVQSGDTFDIAYEWDGAKTTTLSYSSAINIVELF